MNFKTRIANKKSLLITLAYVGTGTVALLIMCSGMDNPGDIINGLLAIILLVTIPVTCISFGVAYSDKHPVHLILLIQSIIFLIFWAVTFFILNRKNKINPN
jgi:putative Ca2+/H+ antiporter (TMEM165/GDT1 family)